MGFLVERKLIKDRIRRSNALSASSDQLFRVVSLFDPHLLEQICVVARIDDFSRTASLLGRLFRYFVFCNDFLRSTSLLGSNDILNG